MEPGDASFPICVPRFEYNEAQADFEQVQMSENVLAPWVDTCEAMAFDPLTKVLSEALAELRKQKQPTRSVWSAPGAR